jgi:hypothetical protein
VAVSDGPGAPRVDWAAVIEATIHPTKILILEAAEWIGEPVSPWLLGDVFEGHVKKGDVAYHLKDLADKGLLMKVGERPSRGALEKFWRPA